MGVFGVTSAFTLINAVWGQPGPNSYVSLTFNGSNRASFTEPLVGGVNVRDFNQDGYQNSINGTSTVQAWSNGLGQRLDRRESILPSEFATQVLASVTVTDSGNEDFSRVLLAALTVSTCGSFVTETVGLSSGPIIYSPLARWLHPAGDTDKQWDLGVGRAFISHT